MPSYRAASPLSSPHVDAVGPRMVRMYPGDSVQVAVHIIHPPGRSSGPRRDSRLLSKQSCRSSGSVSQETAVGTYMSAYVEVDHGEGSPPFSDPMQVHSLTEGSFAFNKDYEVFDALAGGRDAAMAPEDRDPSRSPL